MMRKQVYLLIPLLTSTNSRLQADIEKTLAITSSNYQLYQFDDQKYAVQLHHLNLGYQELIQSMQELGTVKQKLEMVEQAIKQYDWSNKEISIQGGSMDNLMKKAIKYRQIKQQNKKLKKLLQNQLENTEKVRQQTQKTMKVLRQEFDTLVKEMSKQVSDKDKHQPIKSINAAEKEQRTSNNAHPF